MTDSPKRPLRIPRALNVASLTSLDQSSVHLIRALISSLLQRQSSSMYVLCTIFSKKMHVFLLIVGALSAIPATISFKITSKEVLSINFSNTAWASSTLKLFFSLNFSSRAGINSRQYGSKSPFSPLTRLPMILTDNCATTAFESFIIGFSCFTKLLKSSGLIFTTLLAASRGSKSSFFSFHDFISAS